MKILWVKSDFLHPTERGGQIRTLETLRRLHQRHEIHYVAYRNSEYPDGPALAAEYCTTAYPITHSIPTRGSLAFVQQALGNLVDPLPLSIARYKSPQMRDTVEQLIRSQNFDVIVCDFLFVAPNLPDHGSCVLFQHNVESVIWERHAQHSPDPVRRAYFRSQYTRTLAYERQVCRDAAHVIAVSDVDKELMERLFGVKDITVVPTGVDVNHFAAPIHAEPIADLVFVGAMDWMPNIDGMEYFVSEILPLIRRRLPDCTLAIAGRSPGPAVQALAAADHKIRVTGTVPDIRPYLWGSKVSIVPLRIGGGTRLKIYEAMAAGKPVVSTRVGAEGLAVEDQADIFLADDAQRFANDCISLLEDHALRQRVSTAAISRACTVSWDNIAMQFEAALVKGSLRPDVQRAG